MRLFLTAAVFAVSSQGVSAKEVWFACNYSSQKMNVTQLMRIDDKYLSDDYKSEKLAEYEALFKDKISGSATFNLSDPVGLFSQHATQVTGWEGSGSCAASNEKERMQLRYERFRDSTQGVDTTIERSWRPPGIPIVSAEDWIN